MPVFLPALRRLGSVALAGIMLGAVALASPAAATVPQRHHGLGLAVRPRVGQLSSLQIRRALQQLDTPPASVDLTADAPTAGDQGAVSSCVSWAIDYSLLGWYLHHDGRSGQPLAPMYTYSQLVDGQNVGTYFTDTLDIAQAQGVDSAADYGSGWNFDYVDLPTNAEKLNAAHWRISGYEALPIGYSADLTQTSIEDTLVAGKP
jgi:hypothetical protein